jgi:hypothetical protein
MMGKDGKSCKLQAASFKEKDEKKLQAASFKLQGKR